MHSTDKLKKRLKAHRIIGISFFRDHYNTYPGKHSWLLCGKPVYYWKMKAAIESEYLEKIILFTENKKAIKVAQEMSSKFITVEERIEDCKVPEFFEIDDLKLPNSFKHRHIPNRLQWLDFAGTVLEEIGKIVGFVPTVVVSLSMNNPLETAEDINKLVETYLGVDYYEQVFLAHRFTEGNIFIAGGESFHPLWFEYGVRRQDKIPLYITGGSRIGRMRDTYRMGGIGIIETPQEHLLEIHSKDDLALVEFYMRRRFEKA